jgi:hypothetical protein
MGVERPFSAHSEEEWSPGIAARSAASLHSKSNSASPISSPTVRCLLREQAMPTEMTSDAFPLPSPSTSFLRKE